MRKIVSLVLITSLVFITCEKKDEPKEEIKPPDIPVTETTIGQSGGKLKTPTFEIIVPAGAFLSDNTIKITEVEEESGFGENSISEQYLIEGLPDELGKPLKIKIKYNGTLSDQSFIAAGEEAMDAASGEVDVIYDFLVGKDSAGFFIANYPSDSIFQAISLASEYKSVQGNKWIRLEVVRDFITDYNFGTGAHTYDIYIRKDINSLKPEIISYFDQAYNTYLSTLNFKYEFYVNLLIFGSYKINRILVTNVKEDIYCKYLWKIRNNKMPAGIFVINAKKINDTEGMKRMIAREVFRSILFQYDISYPEMFPPDIMDYSWLNQALISWSEEFSVPESERGSYVPSDFKGNEMAPFTGLDYGRDQGEGSAAERVLDFGSGLSSLVKFLSNENPVPSSDTMWAYYYWGQLQIPMLPVDIMVARMNETYNSRYGEFRIFSKNTHDYWMLYLTQYLQGNIYNVSASTFMNAVKAESTFNIKTKDDTLKVYNEEYPELSARLFKIDFQNDEIRKNSKLEINLEGEFAADALIVVFGYKDGKLTGISAGDTVAIKDLSSYSTYLLMVAYDKITLAYDTYTKLKLQVKCTENRVPKYKYCTIQTELKRIREINNFTNPMPEPYVDTTGWAVRWYLKGSFTDNKYEAQIDTSKQGQGSVTGGGEVVLDDDNNLISLHVVAQFEGTGGYKSTWGIDCSNMKPTYLGDSQLTYNYVKNDACLYTDQITGYYEDLISYDKTTGFLCDDRSYVFIKFETEE